MVTCIHFAIHLTVERLNILGTENMVNSEGERFLIIRQTDTSTRCYKTVLQYLTHGVTGIGDGIVVEIATKQDRITRMILDILPDRPDLTCPLSVSLGQFNQQHLRLRSQRVAGYLAFDNMAILRTILL